jgi:GrpB-like predicted nucleotidyltransferase (UPF0157 family)
MPENITVVPYDAEWPELFRRLGRELRRALQDLANRIDHIGSTSILGMSAKPILDIQISVACLEPMGSYKASLESLGFDWRVDNPDLTKRYFREISGTQRVHIHVRQSGSWGEQFSLLFRDYMRRHPEDAAAYSALKYRLAAEHRTNRQAYVDAKGPFIWTVMRTATEWSQATGWQLGYRTLNIRKGDMRRIRWRERKIEK